MALTMRVLLFLITVLLNYQLLADTNKLKASELCTLIVQDQEYDSSTQLPADKRAEFISQCSVILSEDANKCSKAHIAHGIDVFKSSNEAKNLQKEQSLIRDERCAQQSDLLSLLNEKLGNDMKGFSPKKDLEKRTQQQTKRKQAVEKRQAELEKKLKTVLEKNQALLAKKPIYNPDCSIALEAVIRVMKKMLIDEGASFQRCNS